MLTRIITIVRNYARLSLNSVYHSVLLSVGM